jgi:hypothetical protein
VRNTPTRSGGCTRTTLAGFLSVLVAFAGFVTAFAPHASAQPRRVSASEDEPATDQAESTPTADAEAPAEEEAPASRTAPVSVYVIAVPLEDGLEAVAQRAGAAARASLRTIPNVDWQHADRLFLGYDESALTTLSRAREQLEAGRAAYLNLELPEAITQLEGAVADFDTAAAALEDPHDLGQALLLLGASLSFEGRARDATRIFGRLHVQMPHVIPDPNVFPPDVIARYEGARPRDPSSASIVVESDPPGAIAYVDFLARGVTPITVEGLHAGDHIVRVTRAGAVPSVQPVNVRARRSTSTSSMLVDEADAAGLYDALGRVRDASIDSLDDANAIREVAMLLGVERIGVLRATSGENAEQVGLELVVFDVNSGRRLVRGAGSAPVAVGELEPAVNRLVSGALEAAVRARSDEPRRRVVEEEVAPILQQPVEDHSPSIAEDPVFWAVLGGALVLVGAGVAVGVVVADQGPGLGNSPRGQVVFEF